MRVLQILLLISTTFISTAFAEGPPPAKVMVTKVTQREISENRSFLGLLYYDRVSHVSSEVSGLINTVKVREGDRVKEGGPLVSINTEILDKEISLSKTRVEQIELRIRHAEKNYKRLEELYSKSGVSERDYDDALYTYQDSLKEKQASEDGLAKLLIQKRKSEITAPFDGVILEKKVDSGEWVQQGKLLVSIGSTKDLFVRVPVAETLMQFINIGEKVPVEINAFKKEITGTIEDIDPTADPQTKNIFLKVRIPSMEKVAENMSATVFVPTSTKKQLSIIPRDALIKFQGKDFVYSVKDGKATILPVNIVTYLGEMIGVDNPYFVPGMPIVVEGNERLRPDQPVSIEGEN
ncbi:MAG: efflux RND transporter periplasmic adaptor subunit [Proteobacteria bacterium]|nr:efflux RND transporter periplasmic adaptor subunit [Pseudomonadota bacterium]MBU1715355.1 efflux RND transporter periplasmic adaptor subunit [Pseudomonadota bacterium]